ncbi:hypothetical protein P3T23_000762 [Paraburkholderia sp. GAS448]|uniref:hypothetical protein n=1 Tax=Paraburkholderia sp. GAS448 TaxID=3035136 RepID=UPI003D21B960
MKKSPLQAGSFVWVAATAYWLAPSAGAAIGAEAPFFGCFAFFGFFTCFSVGAEYELTALASVGAAGCCARAIEAPKASESPVNNSVSFFIRVSPGRLQVVEPTRFSVASGRVRPLQSTKTKNPLPEIFRLWLAI